MGRLTLKSQPGDRSKHKHYSDAWFTKWCARSWRLGVFVTHSFKSDTIHQDIFFQVASHAKKLQSCFAHHLTTVASAPQNNDLLLFKNSLCSSPFPKLSSPKLLISHPSHFFCSASPLKPRVKDKLGKKAIYWQSPSSTPSSCSSWGDVDDSELVMWAISPRSSSSPSWSWSSSCCRQWVGYVGHLLTTPWQRLPGIRPPPPCSTSSTYVCWKNKLTILDNTLVRN